jgi:hypothetical protein
MDIVNRLAIIAELQPGDPWPTEIFGEEINGWGIAISALCKEAKEEIERLREELDDINSRGTY